MKKVIFAVFVFLAVTLGGAWALSQRTGTASAGDCDNNAVIRCGVSDQKDLKAKYKENKTGDLPELYKHYGITADMINKSTAKVGSVTKSGDVLIGDKVVATGARSVGRQNMPGSTQFTAGGTKFYERSTSVSFRSDSIKAIVFVDEYGKFLAAVITSCGNPVVAKPKPVPVYKCTNFTAKATTRREETVFNADFLTRDVTFKHVTYTVKKGGKVVNTITTPDRGNYTYKQSLAGDYSVEATATVVADGATKTTEVGKCKDSFTIKPAPVYACTSFKATPVAGTRDTFSFVATATAKNGASFKKATYIVRDSANKVVHTSPAFTDLKPYTYKQTAAGTYKASVSLVFSVNGKDAVENDPDCVAPFTVAPKPMVACKSFNIAPVAGTRNKFTFTPAATYSNATFKSVTYTVKDAAGTVVGKPITVNNLNPYTYTQDAAGTYSVSTELKFVAENRDVSVTDPKCVGEFTVKPVLSYACQSFTATQVNRTTFTFSTTAVTQNVTFKSVTYVVKDKTGAVVSTIVRDNLNPYTYVQEKAGEYSVTATVRVIADGKEVVAPGTCADDFTVKDIPVTPVFECTRLTVAPVDGQKNTYRFAITYTAEGGAQITKANVNFGDGNDDDVSLTTLDNFTHTYAEAKDYNVVATLTFMVNGETKEVKDARCSTKVTVNPENCPVPGKEQYPVGSPECYTPCPYNKNLPKDDARCQEAPTQLVNTGPGQIVGLFAATTIAGAFAHRLVWARRFGK